jgi:hypothetical protein
LLALSVVTLRRALIDRATIVDEIAQA